MVPRWMHDAKTITSVSSILEGQRQEDAPPHRSPPGAPEEQPILHPANGKLLFDSGRSTTRVRNPTSCISSRSARGFTRNTIWARVRRMRTPNLLPAEMLLQMLLSGRLAGRAWRLGLPQCRFRAGQHACTTSFSGRNFVFGEVPLDPKSQRNSSNCGDGGVVVLVTSLRPLQLRLTSWTPALQNKGKDEGGHARGKSRCDQFSAVISLVL